jgi:hypothetical protein
VCVSNATGIIECPVELKEFIFSPSSVTIFTCQFKPQATDVGKLIKVIQLFTNLYYLFFVVFIISIALCEISRSLL